MSNAAAKRYLDKVRALNCVACGAYGVHAHHIRTERIKNDYLTAALCPDCHLGAFSIHMSKREFENVYGSELHLLAKTIEALQ